MKLRLRGNTLRLRLTRSEVARLKAGENVAEDTEFAPGQVLRSGITPAPGAAALEASFASGAATVTVPASQLSQWAGSDETGIYGVAGSLEIAIEKDFRCLTRPEERFDPDVFPNPEADSGEAGPDRES